MKTDEQDWADRFGRDVDGLLNQVGQTDPKPLPTEYRQALDLARTLATVDFSDESQVRHTLRRRLLNQIGAREGWQLRKEYIMRTFFRQRRAAVILASVVLVGLLVVTLAWPGALTAAAQAIEDFVQSLGVGPHTTVRQVDPEWATAHPQRPLPATPVVEQRGRLWTIRTAIGNFGGNPLPGNDAAVKRFDTFNEAQAAAPFDLRKPGYLPAGYTLRETMVTPSEWAFLFYDGPYGDIILVQALVYTRVEKISETEMVGTSSSIGILTDGPIEEVELNGRRAAWVEDRSLTWEAEGVSFLLGGPSLSLGEAIRIAESLE